jgi:hypothetical protein
MGTPTNGVTKLITNAFHPHSPEKQKPLSAQEQKIADKFKESYTTNLFTVSESLNHAFWSVLATEGLKPDFLAQFIPVNAHVQLDIESNARGSSKFIAMLGEFLENHPKALQSVTLKLIGTSASELDPKATKQLLKAVAKGANISGVLTQEQLRTVQSNENTALLMNS